MRNTSLFCTPLAFPTSLLSISPALLLRIHVKYFHNPALTRLCEMADGNTTSPEAARAPGTAWPWVTGLTGTGGCGHPRAQGKRGWRPGAPT